MDLLSLFVSIIAIANGVLAADESAGSSSSPGLQCPTLSPGPASTYMLAQSFPPTAREDAASVEAIRRTLALYPLAIDGRNYEVLGQIFTADARANYSEPIGVLNGLDEIKGTLSASLTAFSGTQHSLSSQLIAICSGSTAVSVTYYTAAHFLTPGVAPEVTTPATVLYAYGHYQDTWKRVEDGTWKITNRNLVYMGPIVTAASV